MEHRAAALARAWLAAWNARDLEAILALDAEDAELPSPMVARLLGRADATVRGKAGLRACFRAGLAAAPDLRFELLSCEARGGEVVLTYRDQRGRGVVETMARCGTPEPRPAPAPGRGPGRAMSPHGPRSSRRWPKRVSAIVGGGAESGMKDASLLGLMTHVYTTKEFSVPIENKPEKLVALTKALAAAQVNVLGIDCQGTGPHATVRMLVSDPVKAEATLQEGGYKFEPRDVLCVRAENKPGSLVAITEKLAAGGITVESMYGYAATIPEGEIVLKASDVAQAHKLLTANGS